MMCKEPSAIVYKLAILIISWPYQTRKLTVCVFFIQKRIVDPIIRFLSYKGVYFAFAAFLFLLLKVYDSVDLADLASNGTSCLHFFKKVYIAFCSCSARQKEKFITK